jgi:hypothetical protein
MREVKLHFYVLAYLYDNISDSTDEEQLGGAEEHAEVVPTDSTKKKKKQNPEAEAAPTALEKKDAALAVGPLAASNTNKNEEQLAGTESKAVVVG